MTSTNFHIIINFDQNYHQTNSNGYKIFNKTDSINDNKNIYIYTVSFTEIIGLLTRRDHIYDRSIETGGFIRYFPYLIH